MDESDNKPSSSLKLSQRDLIGRSASRVRSRKTPRKESRSESNRYESRSFAKGWVGICLSAAATCNDIMRSRRPRRIRGGLPAHSNHTIFSKNAEKSSRLSRIFIATARTRRVSNHLGCFGWTGVVCFWLVFCFIFYHGATLT